MITKIDKGAIPVTLASPGPDFPLWAGCPTDCDGLTNGYSRYNAVSPDGRWAIAFGPNVDAAWLVDVANRAVVKRISVYHHFDERTINVGFGHDLRWWSNTTLVCHILNRTIEFGFAAGLIANHHEWSSGHVVHENHCAYGQGMIACRVPDSWGIALKTLNVRNGWDKAVEKHVAYNVYEFAVSPSGNSIAYGFGVPDKPLEVRSAVNPDIYVGATSEMAPQSGHWAWVFDVCGMECLAYWSSQTDNLHIWMPNNIGLPSTVIATMTDINGPFDKNKPGLGTHISTGIAPGWAYMSVFCADDPTQADTDWLLRIDETNPPLLISMGKGDSTWNSTAPKDYAFFSERWGFVCQIGTDFYIVYGSNNNGTTLNELKMVNITRGVRAITGSVQEPAPVPEPNWKQMLQAVMAHIELSPIQGVVFDTDDTQIYMGMISAPIVEDVRKALENSND